MIPLFRRAGRGEARVRRSHRMPELNDPDIYQTVLDGLETGVYIVDRNRRIRFWNQGAEQITGYLRQDVVGRFLRDHLLITGDDARNLDSDLDDPINLVFRDGKPSILDVSILHKDGYRVPIVLRTSPIRNSHGTVVGAAESFEKNRSASESTRRQSGLADFGCLDAVTGVAAREFHGNTTSREPDHLRGTQYSLRDTPCPGRSYGRIPGEPRAGDLCPRFCASSRSRWRTACVRPIRVGCWGENQFIAHSAASAGNPKCRWSGSGSEE